MGQGIKLIARVYANVVDEGGLELVLLSETTLNLDVSGEISELAAEDDEEPKSATDVPKLKLVIEEDPGWADSKSPIVHRSAQPKRSNALRRSPDSKKETPRLFAWVDKSLLFMVFWFDTAGSLLVVHKVAGVLSQLLCA